MDFLSLVVLTKNTSTIPILGPIWNIIVNVLGVIMNVIYLSLEKIGIGNIGLAIIIFTLVMRIILFPTSLNQQKSSRMMQIMQPEMKAIQDKYKNKLIVDENAITPWRFDVARNESMKLIPEDSDVLICTDIDERLDPDFRNDLRKIVFEHPNFNHIFYRYAW